MESRKGIQRMREMVGVSDYWPECMECMVQCEAEEYSWDEGRIHDIQRTPRGS